MNLSLKRRVALSFIITNFVIIILSMVVYQFLSSLKKDIDDLSTQTNKISLVSDQIRISALQILKYQRKILTKTKEPELVDKLNSRIETFTKQLQTVDTYYKDPEIKKVIGQLLSYVDSLKVLLSKAVLFSRDSVGLASISELADKILEAFSEFQDIQNKQSERRNERVQKIIKDTKRHMMITIIIAFLGTIILALVVPGKIALPFKKIKDAIRELQENNFDVSIYYTQDDEIGEIAGEMNKMIHSIKLFDELRTDRISVEKRKFDVLANMVKRPVLLANASSKIVYIPAKIAREEAEEKQIEVENKSSSGEGGEDTDGQVDLIEEIVYQGYANVIPIRGKDSSLDYYLMVLSKELFK